MNVIPLFSGLLTAGYLIDKTTRQKREALDGDEKQEMKCDPTRQPVEVSHEVTTDDPTIPTVPQSSTLQKTKPSDPTAPIAIQDQHYRNRENALFHNVPAWPSGGNRPFIPTRRKDFFMHRHETQDYRDPEIGNNKLTFKQPSVSDVLKRNRPNRKDFINANGQIPQTFSNGVDIVPHASEREGYELSQRRRKEFMNNYVMTNTIRKTQIDGRVMQPGKLTFGMRKLPSHKDSYILDTHRKNIQVTRFPQLSSQVMFSTKNTAINPEMRLGKDKTVQGRTPMVRGLNRSTRPYIGDVTSYGKEDKLMPGRQPGIHNSVYKAPNIAHASTQRDTRRKIDELNVDSFGIARVPSNWVGKLSNREVVNTHTKDNAMENKRVAMKLQKQAISAPGVNTRSGRDISRNTYAPVMTGNYGDKAFVPKQIGITNYNTSNIGLHPTVNLTHEQIYA